MALVPLTEVVFKRGSASVQFASGQLVTIYKRNTETLATVYSDESAEHALSYPLKTNKEGKILYANNYGWLEGGRYDIHVGNQVIPWEAGAGSSTTGANGTNGSTWLSGAGAPSNTIGNGGDFYLDTTNARIYGPKGVGNPGTWPTKYIPLKVETSPEEVETKAPTFFTKTSFWNKPLPTSPPQLTNNTGLMSTFQTKMAYAAGNPWIDTTTFSVPIYKVTNATTKRKITITQNTDPNLQTYFNSVPIPLKEGSPASPAAGTDKHIAIINTDTNEYWEGWVTEVSGNTYTMASGSYIPNITTATGVAGVGAAPNSQSFWGARASALALVGGVITLKEVEEGVIPHALAFSIPGPKNSFIYPAQRTDGPNTGVNDIPEGTCFRLKKSYNVATSGKSNLAKMMMTALQEYGQYVVDQAGVSVFYGEDPTPTGSTAWNTITGGKYPDAILKEIPWSEFETVDIKKVSEGVEKEEEAKEEEPTGYPTVDQISHLTGSAAASPASVAKPASIESGQLKLAFIALSGTATAPLIEGGSTWEKLGEVSNEFNAEFKSRFAVYGGIAGGSEPTNYTIKWTGTAAWRTAEVMSFDGNAATLAAAKQGFTIKANEYGNQTTANAMKPSSNNTLLIHAACGNAGSGSAPPTGYISNATSEIYISTRPMGVAKETTPSGTWGTNHELSVAFIAIT